MRSTDSRSTATDNPVHSWNDKGLKDALVNTMRTAEEISQQLRARGWNVHYMAPSYQGGPPLVSVYRQETL